METDPLKKALASVPELLAKAWRVKKARRLLDSTGRVPVKISNYEDLLEIAVPIFGDGKFETDIYTLDGRFDRHFDRLHNFEGAATNKFEGLLVWDRGNPHDSDAIAVYIEGMQVGYLTENNPALISKFLAKGKLLKARFRLSPGWRGAYVDIDSRFMR